MKLREFREPGMAAFQEFLANCREQPDTPYAEHLLEDDALTSVISPTIEVEFRRLTTKGEAARYLQAILAPLPEDLVAANAGLWTWLSLYFFDEVCPPRHGRRSVKADYYYVFDSRNAHRFYFHLLFVSWHILRVAKEHNRLFLSSPLSSLDKVTSEVMKRLYLTRIPCIFEVLDRLYWDEDLGRARVGIVGQTTVKPGDLIHRLPIRIRQLEKTYDLQSLNADQLIELLGAEFRRN